MSTYTGNINKSEKEILSSNRKSINAHKIEGVKEVKNKMHTLI